MVEPVLRAWEVDADLRRGDRGGFRLKFDGANIIDRSPAPLGTVRAHFLATLGEVTLSGRASFHVTRARYPEPPGPFRLTPDAESLWLRYRGYLDGREPLLSMAYFCLTVLEIMAGDRQAAARTYRIKKDVLDKMGELASHRGDRATARKVTRTMQPLTSPEAAWLEAAVKALIWRLGDSRDTSTLRWITLADPDLPPL